jgi:hypothetical protein
MMRRISQLLVLCCFLSAAGPVFAASDAKPVHVWEKQELTFTSSRAFQNPYTDVVVWVDLTGPNFKKRVYGFWDGGSTFRVRVLATAPGKWHWRSGSTPSDSGLRGKSGSFAASEWSEVFRRVASSAMGWIKWSADMSITNGSALVILCADETGRESLRLCN